MIRLIYRAQVKDGLEEKVSNILKEEKIAKDLVESKRVMTFAAFSWKKNIFLYYECMEEEVYPEEVFVEAEEYLVDWPGKDEPRKWIPMIDVFHFNEPVSKEHWLRKAPVELRKGRVAHLKPEMVSSYIYYHYGLQEEHTFLGGKYEIIAIHEDLLFGYQEFPNVVEEPLAEKRLLTKATPENWNDTRMDLHFNPWEDGHLYFKQIDQIFAYYSE
ncbi:MAG: hypothetical protein K0S61_4357 [Anaerocolumna sp.]|nr:hypothetical protein [Anaerocolumna sp.]